MLGVTKMQTLISRHVGDVAAGLGLQFLHLSQGSFSHDTSHLVIQIFFSVVIFSKVDFIISHMIP